MGKTIFPNYDCAGVFHHILKLDHHIRLAEAQGDEFDLL